MKGCMDGPEHQCESEVEPGATGPAKGGQSTNIQSGLTENLDRVSTNIIMKLKELLYFALFVCLFVQIQSAHTFLTIDLKTELHENFFFTLFKILYCLNISSSLYRTDLKYTSSKSAHTSRVCAFLTQSCLTPC